MARQPSETRQKVLDAAFWEIYRHGFNGASIDRILDGTAVTKGALFHHFPSKQQLGYALVEGPVRAWVSRHWILPLAAIEDPIAQIPVQVRTYLADSPDELVHGGCPLNNLAQELSATDEGFRVRLDAVASEWRAAVADCWARRLSGDAPTGADREAHAAYIVSAIQGLLGLAKATKSRELADRAVGSFARSLRSLDR